MGYTLKYRTYDQLLAEIQSDFKTYNLNDFIDPQGFIKVAKTCNYELGLKINMTREKVIDIENGRGRLPADFYILNMALGVSHHCVTEPVISGTHVEDVVLGPIYNPGVANVDLCSAPVIPDPGPDCKPCHVPPDHCHGCGQRPSICACMPIGDVKLNCKGEAVVLVQRFKYHTRKWTQVYRISIVGPSEFVDINCLNKRWNAPHTAEIKNGFIETSFKTGKLYINYEGALEDEEGNLLVPDHDRLNEYYEYAIKKRVLENMVMNGETVTDRQIQIIAGELRAARNNALSLVNTPDFNELRKIHETNRLAQYTNYYAMFK